MGYRRNAMSVIAVTRRKETHSSPPLTEAGISCELFDESGNFVPCPYTRDNLEAVEAKLILEIPDA